MSIFELAENLILVLTKLDTEHGLAQPQLVTNYNLYDFLWLKMNKPIWVFTFHYVHLVFQS